MTRQPTATRSGDVELFCPICARPARNPHKWKELYSDLVCPKCRNGFANRRQAAYLIDALLWHFAGAPLILYLAALPFEWVDIPVYTLAAPAFLLTNYVGLPLLFFCKDGFQGMSLGKAICGVQVVDRKSREPIGFGRSLQRNLPLLIPVVGFIGIIWTMMNGRRWGDNWARTEVIWRKYRHKRPFEPRGYICTTCGYNLTGNVTGRCPECFEPIAEPIPSPNAPSLVAVQTHQ